MATLPKYDLLEVPWTDVAAWIKAGNDVVMIPSQHGEARPSRALESIPIPPWAA